MNRVRNLIGRVFVEKPHSAGCGTKTGPIQVKNSPKVTRNGIFSAFGQSEISEKNREVVQKCPINRSTGKTMHWYAGYALKQYPMWDSHLQHGNTSLMQIWLLKTVWNGLWTDLKICVCLCSKATALKKSTWCVLGNWCCTESENGAGPIPN